MATRLLALTALLLAAGSGCTGDKDVGSKPYSVEMVRKVFKQRTGDELRVVHTARGVPILGDLTELDVAPEFKSKYGDFAIVVFSRLGSRKRSQLDGGRGADRSGIVWTYHPGENEGDVPIWSARKYYGNVALTWYHPTKETTGQWDRLDGALSALTATRLQR